MRALVTGAGGFLGRRLTDRLESLGWKVGRVVRRSSTGAPPNSLEVELGEGRTEDFRAALDRFGPDIIFHMAGRSLAPSPSDLYFANTILAANLFRAVGDTGQKPTVVLAGSAAEYGPIAPEALPVTEDHPCIPGSDYGISKYAQTLIGLAHARSGFPVMIARIFNPVGPGMPEHLALASFAKQLRSGHCEVLKVGNLDVERDFLDADEAVRIVAALASRPDLFGSVYNVCSGRKYNLRSLVEGMVEMSGRKVRIVTDPSRMRAADMPVFYGSTERLEAAGLAVEAPDFRTILREMLTGADNRDLTSC